MEGQSGLPGECRVGGEMAGAEGPLQIPSASGTVQIEDFPGEIESRG